MKGRFAPSPTGHMHLGNVYSALLSWLSTRSQGGTWLLRIEDLDPQRSRLDYARQIENDLAWLGLMWDEGGLAEGCRQSLRGDVYEDALRRLSALRDAEGHQLTYPCRCTRADIMATQAPHESDGRVVYRGTCRPERLAANAGPEGHTPEASRPPTVRLRVPDAEIHFVDGHYGPQAVNLAAECGDFIVRRADGAWAYQLAVVVDDALMGVTEVVRGRDLLLSVPQQLYLYGLLGYEAPRFCHLPLLCNAAGQRLSKRDRSLDMEHLRRHHTAEEVVGRLAHLAGLLPRTEPVRPQDLVPLFDWSKVPTADILLPNQE